MIGVYEAENGIEAHLLRGLLEQAGIAVHISGEFLLGAMGDLPARGLLRVCVGEDDWLRAREIVARFEDDAARGD